MAALILFSTSVLNVLITIYDLKKTGERSILKRRSKLIMAIEVVFAFGVAGATVSAVLVTSCYNNDVLQVSCVPATSNARFYSFTVPSQVVAVSGFIMAILIMRRMKQVETNLICENFVHVYVCVCLRACVRACVCVCVRAFVLVCVRACVCTARS